MELVGSEVKKTFLGFGTFKGTVQSYDPSSGYFKIHYEDGDSEELDSQEISQILKSQPPPPPEQQQSSSKKTNTNRTPKKRRIDPISNEGQTLDEEGVLKENGPSRVLALKTCNAERQKKKKQKKNTPPVVRRSARRGTSVTPSIEDETSDDDEDADLGGEGRPLVQLPPSSTDLDIDGLNVFDLFSVYTLLRSFSRLLFLSPFRLETFVAALRCKSANFLIDSIHFSILKALKLHLEFLAEEGSGSKSAANCLRYLNWELLDLVTWPVFIVEYLLLNGSRMKPGFNISQLKLLNMEYYKQPAEVKLEILRCLCDDIMEGEAIRSELNRRMTDCGLTVDANYIVGVEKKRKASATSDPGSSLPHAMIEETDDGNSDECCLCGMDGSLICCDGCPAAFHSRCVGVAKDSLPDGDWYCPECLLEKDDRLVKLSKPFRGAELLGTDLHGRLYFASCAYLLVSDSWESDASYHYYNKNDLDAVINVLKSSYASYSAIIKAISMYWGIALYPSSSSDQYGNHIHNIHEGFVQVHSEPALPSKQDAISDGHIERVSVEKYSSPGQCGPENNEVSDLVKLNPITSHQHLGLNCSFACPEPLDEKVHAATFTYMSQQTGTGRSMASVSSSKDNIATEPTEPAVGLGKCIGFPCWGYTPQATDRLKCGSSQLQLVPGSYVNYYGFGRIASSISGELMRKSSENNNELYKSFEDIKSAHLEAISKASIRSIWYTYQKLSTDAQKENCGWCFSCKFSSDSDCFFKVANETNLESSKGKNTEVSKNRTVGLRSEKNKKSHIASAMHHILSIEDRSCGLLSGPWEKPHYSQHWRKAVLKASDVASLKALLLTLELNLRRIALSVEWSKPVEYPPTVVSDSIFVASPVGASSNYGSSKKQVKKIIPGDEHSFTSHSVPTLGINLWRGRRLSRQLFHWKMLPRSLASKGGRQAGCRKIPNILYPDASEFASRSKHVAWRAAVEMSQSVAQLIYQVKDLDSNIRWAELSDTRPCPQVSKESKKKTRPLQKVTIRTKCIEGALVKYLLEFGKRDVVPAVVTRHGVLVEESSKGRKSYWLNETHVPLNLLKTFEVKRIAHLLKRRESRLSKKTDCRILKKTYPLKLPDKERKNKIREKRSKGLSYLFSREQDSEKQLCGHCNKDVLTREAVTCHLCNAFFHRKHFRVPKGAITTTYTCCRCKDKSNVKVTDQGRKVVLKTKKIPKGENLQEIPKTGKVEGQVRKVVFKMKKNFDSEKLQEKPRTGKVESQGRKVVFKMKKTSEGKKLQEIPETGKRILRKSKKKFIGRKKGNQAKSKRTVTERSENGPSWRKRKRSAVQHSENGPSWRKRKRSAVQHSYWLNGLLWSRKPVNERGKCFRERRVLLPLQHMEDPSLKPLCCLCNKEYNSGVTYLSCENCEDWFHGDAFCLKLENIYNLMGFKCHKCRMRSQPVCPFSNISSVGEAQLDRECDNVANIAANTAGVEYQSNDDMLHSGLSEDHSAVAHSEDHLNEERMEKYVVHPGKELVLCPRTILTNGHNNGDQHRNTEGNIHGGSCEYCLAITCSEDHLAVEHTVRKRPEEQPLLYPVKVSTNGAIVQSSDHLETNGASTKENQFK